MTDGTSGSAGDASGPPPGEEGSGTPAPPPGPSPRKLRALIIGSVLALALAVFLFVGLGSSSSHSSAPASVGTEAPEFSLPPLTGTTPVNLDAIGKSAHRPVVLNFFASWCTPCQKETPLLARTAAAQHAERSPVRFIGVDVNDTPADAQPFVRNAGITYPVGVDRTFAVTSGKYALYGLPQTFFIDETGTVVGHVQGALSQRVLDQWVHRLAGGGSGS